MSKIGTFAKRAAVAFAAAGAIGGSLAAGGLAIGTAAARPTGFESQWEDVLYVPGGFNKLACESHPTSGLKSGRFNAWVRPDTFKRTCVSVHYDGWKPFEEAMTFAPRSAYERPPGAQVTVDNS